MGMQTLGSPEAFFFLGGGWGEGGGSTEFLL